MALAVLIAATLAREIQVRRALETLIGTLIHKKGTEHETKIYRADTSHPDDDPASARAYASGCGTMLAGANSLSGEDRIRTCGPVTRTRI